MQTRNNSIDTAAFGGNGWSPRTRSHAMEIGDIWTGCGLDSEWKPLKTVLVHRPGSELSVPVDELQKANGAVGCMTGILHREM